MATPFDDLFHRESSDGCPILFENSGVAVSATGAATAEAGGMRIRADEVIERDSAMSEIGRYHE
jgi:hypothetical protein